MSSISLIFTSPAVMWMAASMLMVSVLAGVVASALKPSNQKLAKEVEAARMRDGVLEA